MNYTDRVAKGRYEAEVELGAATLDDIMPDWFRRIDLERLKLDSQCECVLGQLAVDLQVPNDPTSNPYSGALDQIMPHDAFWWAEDRGFTLPLTTRKYGDGSEWDDLTEAWKRLIRQRLEA